MALAPATVDLMRQAYPQLQLQPMAPPSLAPPLSPDAAAAQQRLSAAPPAPAAPPGPAVAPLPPMRPPGPPKAPPGTVLAQQSVTPGADTSAARAANTAAGEREATAAEKAGADMAAGYRAESEAKAAGAIAQYQQTTMQAAAKADQKRKADARVSELMAQKDQQVDPKAYFKELGIGGTGLAIAAAGLTGALRAVANNKSQVAGQAAPYDMNQNPIVDAIQTQVRQSIELQRDAIANGRADRAQALNVEMQRWGNAEQAELALQSRAMDALARYNDAKAEQHRGTAIEANARQNAEAARARATQLNGQLSLMEQDRSSYTFQRPAPAAGGGDAAEKVSKWNTLFDSAVKQGRSKELAAGIANAATGLRLSVPSGKSEADITREKNTTDIANAEMDQAEADSIGSILGKKVSPKQADRIRADAKALAVTEGEVSGAKNMTLDLVKSLGGKMDMQTGKIAWPDNLTGAGLGGAAADTAGAVLGPLVTTNREVVEDKQKALKEYVTSTMTGANSSVRQDQTFTNMVGGSMLDEDRAKANLQAWADTLWSKSKANRAGAGDAAKLYDHNFAKEQGAEIEVADR